MGRLSLLHDKVICGFSTVFFQDGAEIYCIILLGLIITKIRSGGRFCFNNLVVQFSSVSFEKLSVTPLKRGLL